MKRKTLNKFSAALGLMALGLFVAGSAQACSLAAWTTTVGSPVAGEPTDNPAVKKFSGRCGLAPVVPGPSYVVESASHAAEGGTAPFRGRFFVFTSVTAGNPVVFRAMNADTGGSSVIDIAYDYVDQNFDFTVNGTTASTTAGTAPRNAWIRVEFVYQQSTAFAASTRYQGTTTTLASPPTAGTATVEAVQFGMVAANGATGSLFLDEYEASRAASGGSTVFTSRPQSDANGDGVCNVNDLSATVGEITLFLIGSGNLAVGQTDCNQDGAVNVNDLSCQVNDIVNAIFGTPCT